MPRVNWRVESGLMCKNESPIDRKSLVARGSLSDMVYLAMQTNAFEQDHLFIMLDGDRKEILWPEICLMYAESDFPQII